MWLKLLDIDSINEKWEENQEKKKSFIVFSVTLTLQTKCIAYIMSSIELNIKQLIAKF